MLDGLPPQARHLALMLLASVLTWIGSDVLPWLDGRGGWAAVLGPLVAVLMAWLTPLTRQYGAGAERTRTQG